VAPADQSSSTQADAKAQPEKVRKSTPTDPSQTPTRPTTDALFAKAAQAVDADDYAKAVAIVTRLGDNDQNRIARKVSRRLGERAARALKIGNRNTAATLLAEAADYPSTPQARKARAGLRAAQARAAAARAAKRRAAQVRAEQRRVARAAKAQREREARAAQRAAEEAAAAQDAAPQTDDPSQYAGMNCTEIGHSFTVTPGSDPEHDADNDGVACESQ